MQGRELGLVLVVALVAGAAGAFGAVAIRAATDTSGEDLKSALEKRFDRIETSIARNADDAKAARTDAAELKQRLASMETTREARRAETAPGVVSEPQRPGRAKRTFKVASDGGGTSRFEVSKGDDVPFLGGVQIIDDADLSGASGILSELPAEMQEQIAKQMEGLTNSFKLRGMPEDQRWAKAKEELGLNDGQVDALKQAVTERDTAMKDAMKPLKESTTGNGGTVSIRTMDPSKAVAADASYRSKVDQTLDENQRKTWNEKGWSNAFGRPGGSGVGVSVISADTMIDVKAKDPK